jgi:hypothetical protein
MSAHPSEDFAMRFARAHADKLGVATLLTIYFLVLARHIPPTGDEMWYLAIVDFLDLLASQVLDLEFQAASRTLFAIADRGWYMPGMALLVWPMTWISDSTPVLRLFMGVCNFSVLCLITTNVREIFGARARTIFIVCTLSLPYYALYAFVVWGDLLGAQIFLLINLQLVRRIRESEGQGLTVRHGALFGLALAFTTYLRGFYWLALPLLLVGVFYSSSALEDLRARSRHLVVAGGTMAAVFLLALSPWSMLATAKFGFHLTTTSLPISQIIAFGSHDYINSTQLRAGVSIFDHLHDYIVQRADASNTSFREQSREELAKATADLTLDHYLRSVLKNMEAYYFDSETFMERFRRTSRASEGSPSPDLRDSIHSLLQTANHWIWRILLVAGFALFAFPVTPGSDKYYLSTFFKYSIFLYTLQPLVVFTHGRYYVQYVPFIAVAIALASSGRSQLFGWRRPTTLDEGIVAAGQVIAALFAALLLAAVIGLLWIFPADG